MAISDVQICNMALDNVGASANIETLNDLTFLGRLCKRWYDPCRREVLEAFDWSFARKRLILATHGDDPPIASASDTSGGRWQYRYQYPADCISLRFLENPLGPDADPVPFEVEISDNETKSIVTDLDDAVGVYTFDQTNTAMFSLHFVSTLSWLITSRIAFPVTKKLDYAARAAENYNRYLRRAPALNANERVQPTPRDGDIVRARDA